MDRDLELAGLKGGVTSTLFARTMLCLVGLLAISGATSVLSWGVALSGAAHIALFVSALVLLFVSTSMAESDSLWALLPAGLFAGLFGYMLGPTLSNHVETLGAGTVTFAVAATTGMMAICGAVASVVAIPYRKFEGPLLLILFGLIIFGSWRAVSGIDLAHVDLLYSLIGSGVFVIYFLVDFARLYDRGRAGATGWGEASLYALNLYLDYINLLLHILAAAEE